MKSKNIKEKDINEKSIFYEMISIIKDLLYDIKVMLHNLFKGNKIAKISISNKKKNKLVFYICMIAFPVLQFSIFYIGVNLNSILLAFKEYDYFTGKYTWVFVDNFVKVINDTLSIEYLNKALTNSIVFFLFSLFIGMTLSIIISYYIYKKFKMSETFKIFLFLPNVVSSLAIVICYKYFVETAVPVILEKILNVTVSGMLTNQNTVFGTIVFYNIWFGMGNSFLIYVSSMSNISNSVVESAQLEGISPIQEFWYITLPLIYPIFITLTVVAFSVIFVHQMNVYSFYGDAAEYNIYSIGYFLYRSISKGTISDYPYLSAFGIILTLITVFLCFFVKKVLIYIRHDID